jgi:hypothetical protein
MTARTQKAVDSIIASGTAFARAVDELRSADIERGGDGLLRDCLVSLADDRIVMLYTDWNDDSKTLLSWRRRLLKLNLSRIITPKSCRFSRMTLTHQQKQLIETKCRNIPPARRSDFEKFIADVLRGRLELRDTDIWFATTEALHRYGDHPED